MIEDLRSGIFVLPVEFFAAAPAVLDTSRVFSSHRIHLPESDVPH